MIEEGSPISDPDVVEYMRIYSLIQIGLPPNIQDDQPAVTLDWLLKIHQSMIARQRKELGGG